MLLFTAVEELYLHDEGRTRSRDNLKSTWVKQSEIIKEPNVYALRNLLFNFPGIGSLCFIVLLHNICFGIVGGTCQKIIQIALISFKKFLNGTSLRDGFLGFDNCVNPL